MNYLGNAMLISLCWVLAPSNILAQTAVSANDDEENKFGAWINKGLQGVRPAPMKFEDLPGAAKAVELVERSASCRRAVGGDFARYVIPRLSNTAYLAYWSRSARMLAGDRAQVLLGYANVENRVVVLLQSFFEPTKAKAEWAKGGSTEPIDIRPYMEKALGLKAHSLTADMIQAWTLLHETAHLNAAIPPDDGCMKQSMANYLRIARACTPDLIETQPSAFYTELLGDCRAN